MPPFIQNLLALPAKTKAILGVSFVAILAIAFIMLKVATAPSYSLIASGIDPSQTGKITAALDEQGIAYELRNNGTALAVTKTSMAQARIALATAGVQATGGTQPGYELLDESKLGASQFQQQVTYQRALEGEIARTLQRRRRASRTRPCRSSCRRTTSSRMRRRRPRPPSSSATPSDTLAPGAVRGMAQTAASSVKGLKSENVTITDSTGADPVAVRRGRRHGRLRKQGLGRGALRPPDGDLDQRDAHLHARRRQGAGQGQRRPQRRQVQHRGAHVRQDGRADHASPSETETMKGAGATTGGTAGTGSNVPTYSGSERRPPRAAGNYNNKKVDTNFGVNKKVTKTETAPGAVNKLQVALMVDKSVPKATFDSLQKTVATAAGLDQTTRGDTITAMQVAFPKAEDPKAGPVPTTMLGPLKWVGLGLASLLFLFFMARGMKQAREREPRHAGVADHDRRAGLPGPARGRRGHAGLRGQHGNSMLAPRVPDASLHQLDQLMEREPERVAAQVKAWMAED